MESIIAWNVNGMRSAHRLAGARSFVSTVRDDTSILVLVDTRRSAIEAKKKKIHGYRLVCAANADVLQDKNGKPYWSSGVEIWCKSHLHGSPIRTARVGTFGSRLAAVDVEYGNLSIRIIGVYAMQSGRKEATFHNNDLARETLHLIECSEHPSIVTGDFNRMNTNGFGLDAWETSGRLGRENTFVSYCCQYSGRLDYFFTSEDMGRCHHMGFPCDVRNEKRFSDHRPIRLWLGNAKVSHPSVNCAERRIFLPDWVLKTKHGLETLRTEVANLPPGLTWQNVAKEIRKLMWTIRMDLLTHDDLMEQMIVARSKHAEEVSLRPNPHITSRLRAKIRTKEGDRLDLLRATDIFKDRFKHETLEWTFGRKTSGNPPFRISKRMIRRAIKGIKVGKSPGPSGVTGCIMKAIPELCGDRLTPLFNGWLRGEEIDSWWKRRYITLLYKGHGDSTDPNNWRPISLLNQEWKVFTAMVARQMKKLGWNVGPFQTGWQEGRWIHENVLVIQAGLRTGAIQQRGQGGAVATDVSKAFDRMFHRKIVMQAIENSGRSWGYLIFQIIVGGTARIYLDGWLGPWFAIERGVGQGDVPSPHLFIVTLAPWLDKLHMAVRGIWILGQRFTYVAFADDNFIFGRDDEDLRMIRELTLELGDYGLEVNDRKTKFIPFLGSPNLDETIAPWDSVNEFRQLGVDLSSEGAVSWKSTTEKFKYRLTVLRSGIRSNSLLHKVELVKSYGISMLVYPLRIAEPSMATMCEWYHEIFEFLGFSKVPRVGFDRLTTPVRNGGYGLPNLQIWSRQLKLGWITYVMNQTNATFFTDLVDAWSMEAKKMNQTIVGPLLSWEAMKVPFWEDIANECTGIMFSIKGPERAAWRETDVFGEDITYEEIIQERDGSFGAHPVLRLSDGTLQPVHDSIPKGVANQGDASTLRRDVIALRYARWMAKEKRVPSTHPEGSRRFFVYFDLEKDDKGEFMYADYRKAEAGKKTFHGMYRQRLRLTSSQRERVLKRDEEVRQGINYAESPFAALRNGTSLDFAKLATGILKVKLTDRIRMEVFDMIHENKAIYKGKEECWGCGEVLTALHLAFDCSARERIRLILFDIVMACRMLPTAYDVLTAYVMWAIHVWAKHEEPSNPLNMHKRLHELKKLEVKRTVVSRCIGEIHTYLLGTMGIAD